MRGRCCAGMPPARGEAEGFAGRRMRLPGLRRGAVCRFCRLSVVRHVPPHPNPLPPGRGNRSSPAIQRYRICRPGQAEPPPGIVAPVPHVPPHPNPLPPGRGNRSSPAIQRHRICRPGKAEPPPGVVAPVPHVSPHPNPLPPVRGNRSSPAIQRHRICRPGQAEPPPGISSGERELFRRSQLCNNLPSSLISPS